MGLACLFMVLMATSAQGELFTWIDSRGTAHYTNSLYEVPARYRAKVKVLNLGPEPKAEGPSSSAQQAPTPAQPVQQAPPVAVEQHKPQRPALTKGRHQRRRGGEADE